MPFSDWLGAIIISKIFKISKKFVKYSYYDQGVSSGGLKLNFIPKRRFV